MEQTVTYIIMLWKILAVKVTSKSIQASWKRTERHFEYFIYMYLIYYIDIY